MCSAGLPDGIDKDMSVILLIINVFLPGVGTLVASCLATECDGVTVVVGIIQILTSFLIVGWVWAVIWSVNLYKKAADKAAAFPTTQHTHPQTTPVAQPPPAAQPPYGQMPPPQAPHGHVPPPPKFVGSPPPPAPQ